MANHMDGTRTSQRKANRLLSIIFAELNAENKYRIQSFHLHLHQIVYGNTMLQFEANTNIDVSVDKALPSFSFNTHYTLTTTWYQLSKEYLPLVVVVGVLNSHVSVV